MGCLVFLAFVVVVVIAVVYVKAENEKTTKLENARRARDEYERRTAEANRAEEERAQRKYLDEIVSMNEESLVALESMPREVETAEQFLDQAERDFAEGAFAPFWSSIERATLALATFDQNVSTIEKNSSKYLEVSRKYRGQTPQFTVSRGCAPRMRIASVSANRLSKIVRNAQRNFEFSVIYEQRKTNQILVAGFKNLGHALEYMTSRITSSIDSLSESVDNMTWTLNRSLEKVHEQNERLISRVGQLDEGLKNTDVARSAREQQALEMLDNVQRRRYPNLFHGGLR